MIKFFYLKFIYCLFNSKLFIRIAVSLWKSFTSKLSWLQEHRADLSVVCVVAVAVECMCLFIVDGLIQDACVICLQLYISIYNFKVILFKSFFFFDVFSKIFLNIVRQSYIFVELFCVSDATSGNCALPCTNGSLKVYHPHSGTPWFPDVCALCLQACSWGDLLPKYFNPFTSLYSAF